MIERQKKDQESSNNGLGKTDYNKHPAAEGEQHTVMNKLKEYIQIMWHNMRLLPMSERERLPKLKENSKLTKLKEEIYGITEKLLEEDESDITDKNYFMSAAATIMTQTINQPSKRSKNRRNENFWKIRMQRLIRNWRKELSIMAETGTGSDNGKLHSKKRKIFQNVVRQMPENLHR